MRRKVGNLLIAGSILLLCLIYLPVVGFFIPFPQKDINSQSFYIQIPKIHAQAPVVENVDPFQEAEYKKALEKGVALAKGSSNYFFAHSSLEPWRITRTNTAFLRLYELNYGDQIFIFRNGQKTRYQVVYKKEVWPNQVEYLTKKSPDNQIILQTCTPLGTSLKRLLVFADQV